MDEDYFIKIEYDSPIKTTPHEANYFMTQFYDQDSADDHYGLKKENFHYGQPVGSDQLLEKLDSTVDLRTMSVSEIVSFAKENYIIEDSMDWQNFETKLRKRKIILKRNHAKGRDEKGNKKQFYVISDSMEGVNMKEEIQAEIKKKRNRMSAQVSRDRRKMKIQELQYNNEKLKAETEKIMQENQKLKRQLEEFNKVQEKKFQSSKGKNRFLSFIIMLGMFFLLTILRQNTKSNPLGKITAKLMKSQNQIYSAEQQSKVIEDGQKAFKDFQLTAQPLLGGERVIKNVMFKLQEMKSSVEDVQIPKQLKRQLSLIKKQII